MTEYETLYVADEAAWRAWLETHGESVAGVRLAIAKKGGAGASATYAEAVNQALCFGWIDGPKASLDADHYLQTFTPRRARSIWSARNRELVDELIASGRMTAPGLREVERAQADGRWDAAYQRGSDRTVPDDLAAALAANPEAAAFFETLTAQNRYAIVFRTTTAKRAETRARRIGQFVEMLAKGETIYPQKRG